MKHHELNAWYSENAAYRNGSSLYRTPDGQIVECTEVSDADKPTGLWDDAVSLGPVTKCVRGHGCPFCKSTKHTGIECPHEDKVSEKLIKINDPQFTKVTLLLRVLKQNEPDWDDNDGDV